MERGNMYVPGREGRRDGRGVLETAGAEGVPRDRKVDVDQGVVGEPRPHLRFGALALQRQHRVGQRADLPAAAAPQQEPDQLRPTRTRPAPLHYTKDQTFRSRDRKVDVDQGVVRQPRPHLCAVSECWISETQKLQSFGLRVAGSEFRISDFEFRISITRCFQCE